MMALESTEVTVTKWEPLKFLKEGQYLFISFTTFFVIDGSYIPLAMELC